MSSPSNHSARERKLILVAAFLRAFATGMVGVLIGIYLARRGFDAAQIGLVVGGGLGGAALAALLVTLFGDRIGRKRALVALSLMGAVGGACVVLATSWALVVGAAFVGMLNGMGRDRGAALIMDQAMLPATARGAARTVAFAWYNAAQDVGHALGGLAAGATSLITRFSGLDELSAAELAMWAYCVIVLATAIPYALLSRAAEARPHDSARVSPATRRLLWKISSLFALDSLAGGFLTAALLSYFFFERFGASEAAVGALFFGARIANACSHLAAAWLARRIGLVNTMVFTHIPSSLLLVTVAFAPSFPVAAVLFLVREGLVEMDVPTRQSYVMAMVQPNERTLASGVTHLVRLGAWAVAPAFAGLLMRGTSLEIPLYVGAAMKIAYDLLLYAGFRKLRPSDEATKIQ